MSSRAKRHPPTQARVRIHVEFDVGGRAQDYTRAELDRFKAELMRAAPLLLSRVTAAEMVFLSMELVEVEQ
jgi:hypothetical protein